MSNFNNKVAFFLPTRKGSQRVKNKNTRPFANYEGGLVELKLSQLLDSTFIDEIIFSSNDENCLLIAEKYKKQDQRLKIVQRPNELCLDSTNLQDLISYVPSLTNMDHILWGHVTTPMIDGSDYDKAIKAYFENLSKGFDSLVSVLEFKNFLLNKSGRLINNLSSIQWPRTQDLESLFEINHGMFIAPLQTYLKEKNRLGTNPYLYCMDKIKSMDIDWDEDFYIAESVYKEKINKQ